MDDLNVHLDEEELMKLGFEAAKNKLLVLLELQELMAEFVNTKDAVPTILPRFMEPNFLDKMSLYDQVKFLKSLVMLNKTLIELDEKYNYI